MFYVVVKIMNKEYIISEIEKIINNEQSNIAWDLISKNSSALEAYLVNVAMRLAKTYEKYVKGGCGVADYLVALRSFMLSYQVSIRLDDANTFQNLDQYGIYCEATGMKYYAVYNTPQYITRNNFVSDAFVDVNAITSVCKSKYNLKTNAFIEQVTGFKYFKSLEQKLCVFGALNTPKGYTTLVSMPTGGGKSLVTQVLGYENRGLSIVIVPTVSLAIDQERAARENVKGSNEDEIFCYYSGIANFEKIKKSIEEKKARLLFISPEALIKNEQFGQLISKANADRYLQNVIIDEAHIVVAWGDFFRVDYQCLSPWRNELLKVNPDIRTFLLSATFRDDTVDSLKQMFGFDNRWLEIRCDSLRKEPHFVFTKAKNYSDKRKKIVEMVKLLPHPMILYVNAPYEANNWKSYLEGKGFGNVHTFTGDTKSDERKNLIDSWVKNEFDLMIATSAFGVGVDKPDVRTVIHLYMPESADTYYQELGRGGRDGLPCLSVMCIEEDDINNAFNHVSKVLTTEKFWGRWWSMYRNPNNQWQGGAIAIMASTKPNYNKINYFEEGNDTDEKWNINVLLLLNRRKQIKIVGLDLDAENRYIFTIKILNDIITQDTDMAKEVFEEIRKEESLKSLNAFSTIRNSVEKADRLCWSEMFYETYPLVSECCPGCNNHDNKIISEVNRFPLVVDVSGPEKEITDDMKEFFSNTHEAVYITEVSPLELIQIYKPNVVVCDSIDDVSEVGMPGLNYMNYQELRELQAHDDGFYISGLVMAIYSDDKESAKNQYQIMYKYINSKRYVLHITKFDFCISNTTGKMLTDQVDGTVIK